MVNDRLVKALSTTYRKLKQISFDREPIQHRILHCNDIVVREEIAPYLCHFCELCPEGQSERFPE